MVNVGKMYYTWILWDSYWVVATQIFFIFTPKIGEMIQFGEHIFQMG